MVGARVNGWLVAWMESRIAWNGTMGREISYCGDGIAMLYPKDDDGRNRIVSEPGCCVDVSLWPFETFQVGLWCVCAKLSCSTQCTRSSDKKVKLPPINQIGSQK